MTKEEFIQNIINSGFYTPSDEVLIDRGLDNISFLDFFFYDYEDDDSYIIIALNKSRTMITIYYYEDRDILAPSKFDASFWSYDEAWGYLND